MNLVTKAFLQRTREKLSETLNATLNAATSGTRHVLQHPETGAVLSARTGFWTYSLGEAYGVTPEGPAVLGAVVVPVPTAREVMLGKLEAAKAEVERRVAAGRSR